MYSNSKKNDKNSGSSTMYLEATSKTHASAPGPRGAAHMHHCAMCSASKSCLPLLAERSEQHMTVPLVRGQRRVARNTLLCREGDQFHTLYIVRLGQFKILSRDPTGELRVVKFHMQGDVIGMDAIASGAFPNRAMALEDSEVCEVSYAQLRHAMFKDPPIADQLLRTMSKVMVDQHERSNLLSLASPEARFVSFLLSISKRYARLGYSSHAFRLPMSRSDIGSYLGTTVETVSRLISRLNAQDTVAIRGRLVELRNREALQEWLEAAGGGVRTDN